MAVVARVAPLEVSALFILVNHPFESPPPLADHYAVLGLDRRCTLEQVRLAYRLLSKKHHPDVNAGADQAMAPMQRVNAAYEVLGDPQTRRAYDRELAAQAKAQQRAGRTERNLKQDVHLRLEEFFRGTTLQVRVKDPADPGHEELLELEVPPETAPGTLFKVPRTGRFEGGVVALRVRLFPGPRFKARGSDVRTDLRISARRAEQGGTEMLPGSDGRRVTVEIPAKVGRGEIVRIAGGGLPKPRGGRGDLLVKISYRVEVQVTRHSRRN